MFGLYCAKEESEAKRTALRHALGLTEAEASEIAVTASLDEAAGGPKRSGGLADDDEDFF